MHLNCVLAVCFLFHAAAGGKVLTEGAPWIVATQEAPPFAMKTAQGEWEGISVDLWREIAATMGIPYEFRELPVDAALQGVKTGTIQAAIGDIAITAGREALVDFTNPYFVSGLGIAVAPKSEKDHWLSALRAFWSLSFLKIIFLLAFAMSISGLALWIFERKRNPEKFGGAPHHGLGAAFWWAAVTMTTVGYGDKVPITTAGRAVAILWMFTGVVLVSGFTAAIASAITASRMQSHIRGPSDLPHFRVASVEGTAGAAYLRQSRISAVAYPTPEEAMTALIRGEADAFVDDKPILTYLAHRAFRRQVEVLPHTFQRQDYGVVLHEKSSFRKKINAVLLDVISKPIWKDIQFRYLGESS